MAQSLIKFGTDGWRAIIGEQFTFDNARLVTQAIADYVIQKFGTERPVLLGYDGRFLGDRFADEAGKVLRQNGLNTLRVSQYTPTPLVAFAAKHYKTAGAMMFTASHNPPEYMGIKFIPDYAGPATPDITDDIVSRVHQYQQSETVIDLGKAEQGTHQTVDPYPDYLAFLKTIVDFDLIKQHPMKVLYDPMYGAGYGYVDRIFREEIGWVPDMIHDQIDPRFGGQLPEPKDEYLETLIDKVVKGGYALGVANDGDADRFGIIDETGTYLSNNFIMPLFIRYLYHHKGKRGAGVRTLATSALMNALGKVLDFPVYETKVGFKHVGEIMRKEPVIVGGEESGGLSVIDHIPEKDGILGILLMVEMLAKEAKPLTHVFEDLQVEANFRTHYVHTNLHLTQPEKEQLMATMADFQPGQTFNGRELVDIDRKDGVKLIFAKRDGKRGAWPYEWLLVRPSGTEPVIRLYGESQDEAFSTKMATGVRQLLNKPAAV